VCLNCGPNDPYYDNYDNDDYEEGVADGFSEGEEYGEDISGDDYDVEYEQRPVVSEATATPVEEIKPAPAPPAEETEPGPIHPVEKVEPAPVVPEAEAKPVVAPAPYSNSTAPVRAKK